jgi:hypothetical protein
MWTDGRRENINQTQETSALAETSTEMHWTGPDTQHTERSAPGSTFIWTAVDTVVLHLYIHLLLDAFIRKDNTTGGGGGGLLQLTVRPYAISVHY